MSRRASREADADGGIGLQFPARSLCQSSFDANLLGVIVARLRFGRPRSQRRIQGLDSSPTCFRTIGLIFRNSVASGLALSERTARREGFDVDAPRR